MALAVKQKPRHAQNHKKRSGLHQKRTQRFMKTYWPYIPMAMIVAIGLVISNVWTMQSKQAVLAYATEMSVSNLYDGTNSQRTSNGLGALSLNGQLNSAAQAKANDMVARDYWSHNTPDGQPPWVFISQAGYNYRTAGENLAYGFDTSSATISGWMNSPGHRANILNSGYQDVGFGIANSSNYQGSGPETVVVAMYGSRATAPAPAPSSPTPTAPIVRSSPKSASPSPSPSPAPVSQALPTPTAAPPTTQQSVPVTTAQPANSSTKLTKVPEPPSKRVARIQVITEGGASWSMFAVSSIASIGFFVFLIKHTKQWQKVVVKGEAFVMHHATLDILLILIIVTGFVLTRSSGLVR